MSGFEVFLQQVINAITVGSYLALIAIGYTMVYGIIELINFAHGDVFALGFFVALTLLGWIGISQTLTTALSGFHLVWVLAVVMAGTMLCTGLANLAIDRVAYKPLRRAPRLAPLITAVGASFALENILQNWYGPSQIFFPAIFPTVNLAPSLLGPASQVLFTTKDIFLLGVTIPLMVAL
ncbi:MAG: branched-chain amino acid ABC transporter permease, partial [candidate division NC10 bacterium]|nr:branched-chain amino acid ABC transporter permease [candidate division NC10 bacterium]